MKEETLTIKKLEALFTSVNGLPPVKRTQFVQKMEELAKSITLGNGDTIDGFIYKTRDTNQFGSVHGNRIINEESPYVRDLAQSISEIGNIAPVIINENGQTIDGQRRITAVRKYGLANPIRYTRVSGANISTVGELNRLQATWTYKDWLHKYTSMGNAEYVKYEELDKKFSKYMRPRSLRSLLMNNRIEAFKPEVWEHGEFKINMTTYDQAISFLELLQKIYALGASDNVFAKSRDFQRALHEIYRQKPNLDQGRLLKKIQMNFNRLNVKTSDEEYTKILLDIYNVRLGVKENKILLDEFKELESKTA